MNQLCAIILVFFPFLEKASAQIVSIDSLHKPQRNGHFCEIQEDKKGLAYFEGNIIYNATTKPLIRSYYIYKNAQFQAKIDKNCIWAGELCSIKDSMQLEADSLKIYKIVLSIGDSAYTFDSIFVGLTFLSCGQSNNIASNHQTQDSTSISPDIWIRGWGKPYNAPINLDFNRRCYLADPNLPYTVGSVGLVDFGLAQHLKDSLYLPICVINGAVSSTTIAQHQRNDRLPSDDSTVYGRMLARYRAARFRHPLFLLWHQGEADMITDIGAEKYRELFQELQKDWQEDYGKNLAIFVVQVHTAACYSTTLMSLKIAEKQRHLGDKQISISGIANGGTMDNCHFLQAGYKEIADRVAQVWQGNYFPQALNIGNNSNDYFISFSQPMSEIMNIEHFIGITRANHLIIQPLSATINDKTLILTFPESVDSIGYTAGTANTDTLSFLRSKTGLAAFTFYLSTTNPTSTSLIAYPNPTVDILFIPDNQNITVLSDISGRIVAQYPYGVTAIDLRQYPTGCYVLQILEKGQMLILKQ